MTERNETEDAAEAEEGPQSARSKLKLMIFIAVGVLLLVTLLVVGAWFVFSGGEASEQLESESETSLVEEPEPLGPAIYLSVEPAFIVNYAVGPRTRYLQLELSLVARDNETIDVANMHMPLIRNNLLEVLSQQDYDALQSLAGKEKLVKELTQALQDIMQEKIERPGFETVLFRSFVMQ